jgi:hypothetical protein
MVQLLFVCTNKTHERVFGYLTDIEQSSISSSRICLQLGPSRQQALQAQVKLVLWAWDNRRQQDWSNSTSSSLTLCPWLVGGTT